MSLRRNLLTLVLATSFLQAACMQQRPFYRDIVQPAGATAAAGTPVELVVLDAETNQPVNGAKVIWGEDHRSRESFVTGEDGRVAFEVSQSMLKENPLVEVVLPAGVTGYRLQFVPAAEPAGSAQAPEADEAPAAPEMPAAEEAPEAEAGN